MLCEMDHIDIKRPSSSEYTLTLVCGQEEPLLVVSRNSPIKLRCTVRYAPSPRLPLEAFLQEERSKQCMSGMKLGSRSNCRCCLSP